MEAGQYLDIKGELIEKGYGNEIDWAEDVKPCEKPILFFQEYGWVIINSGMKNQVARIIWDRIVDALLEGRDISEVFNHKGKVAAIKYGWKNQEKIFNDFKKAVDKLSYLKSLPWIGDITKFHLAKNLGYDYVKPDRHLVRIARKFSFTPYEMCIRLSKATGDRLGVVDLVIWRAGNLGML